MILHYTDEGSGNTIILLHGMAGSTNYWQEQVEILSKSHRVIALDLLGFGRSPESSSGYSADTHCRAIKDTLDSLQISEPIQLVGHSMGALVALQYALRYQNTLFRMLLLNMPIYQNQEEARVDITQGKRLLKYAYYGASSRLLCRTWCYHLRPVSRRVAPLYLRDKPPLVASDSVLHTWESYSESLHHLIEQQTVQKDLQAVTIPVSLIYGTKESETVLQNVQKLELPRNVRLEIIDGSHNLPLEYPDIIAEHIT